jgi:hypothetical protein
MKTQLAVGGPFYSVITVYDDLFAFGGSGVYRPNPAARPLGGHAVEIIGYSSPGADPRAQYAEGYWVCKNSWGTDWPVGARDAGIFALAMGGNVCGVESRCGFAEPVLHVDAATRGAIARAARDDGLAGMRFDTAEAYLAAADK